MASGGSLKLLWKTAGIAAVGRGSLSMQFRLFGRNHGIYVARTFASYACRRSEINKVIPSAADAIKDLKANSTLLSGGFGLCGVPDTLLNAVEARPDITGLTVISSNPGTDTVGLGRLIGKGQVKRMVSSYLGENKTLERKFLAGEIELELVPQGTLAERCRAGGAGIPAFYTPTAYGTAVQTGELPLKYNTDGTVALLSKPREVRQFDGRSYIMERAITGDYAFVKAWRADKLGNSQFRFSAQNFNGVMGRSGKVTIVEAEEIVDEIEPASIHLPGIYVTSVIKSLTPKPIERLMFAKEKVEDGAPATTVTTTQVSKAPAPSQQALMIRERIVRRATKELKDGMHVNLGIGMPMLASNFVDPSITVFMHSENGILGLGPYPRKGQEDPDIINAGKETVTLTKGASVFGSDESFGMVRGGRLDLTILGAMQVSQYGDLASWTLPGKVKGMGGAMDLVCNPTQMKVIVTMAHTDKKGNPKILPSCVFPLTGKACVSKIITELCVFEIDFTKGLTLVELADGVTVEEIRQKTAAAFNVADVIKPM